MHKIYRPYIREYKDDVKLLTTTLLLQRFRDFAELFRS